MAHSQTTFLRMKSSEHIELQRLMFKNFFDDDSGRKKMSSIGSRNSEDNSVVALRQTSIGNLSMYSMKNSLKFD